MRLAPLLVLALGCAGTPEPPVNSDPNRIEHVDPEPPLPPHDLAGAPPYGEAPPCTPAGQGPGGAELAAAVEALRAGTPATVHHGALLARCEIERRALADAFVEGAVVARGARRERLATTLLVQALHADPSHLTARINLAAVLAATGRPLAALTHLCELRRGGEEGLALLAQAGVDRRFADLGWRPEWLPLLFPETHNVEPTALTPGEGIALPALPDPPAEPGMSPVEIPEGDWNAILLATPGVPAVPDGAHRAQGNEQYFDADGFPIGLAVFPGGGFHPAGARYYRVSDGTLYLRLLYVEFTAGGETVYGYALYRIAEGRAEPLRVRRSRDTPCENGEPAAADVWFDFPDDGDDRQSRIALDREEIRELRQCGAELTLTRIRHENGALRARTSSFSGLPHPTAAAAGDWVPSLTAREPVPEVDGVPAFAPPPTCLPDPSAALSGDALRARLDAIAAGQADADVAALVASCTVDSGDVAHALALAARARATDPRAATELLGRALRADPGHLESRYELAAVLAASGSADAAQRQLEELLRAKVWAAPSLTATTYDPRFASLRARAPYWQWIESEVVRRFIQRLSIAALDSPGEPLSSRLPAPAFAGEAHTVVAGGPWSAANALLRASMTPRQYRQRPHRERAAADLPEPLRDAGFVRLERPVYWRAAEGVTLLAVPYLHPEEGFDAVALYSAEDGGGTFHFLGRERVDLRDCGMEDELADIGFDARESELRLVTVCDGYVGFCRFAHEAGALRQVCTSFQPDPEP